MHQLPAIGPHLMYLLFLRYQIIKGLLELELRVKF